MRWGYEPDSDELFRRSHDSCHPCSPYGSAQQTAEKAFYFTLGACTAAASHPLFHSLCDKRVYLSGEGARRRKQFGTGSAGSGRVSDPPGCRGRSRWKQRRTVPAGEYSGDAGKTDLADALAGRSGCMRHFLFGILSALLQGIPNIAPRTQRDGCQMAQTSSSPAGSTCQTVRPDLGASDIWASETGDTAAEGNGSE